MRTIRRIESGFTLSELLIAMFIVGILAAISTPVLLKYSTKSRYGEIMQAGDSVKGAVAACVEVKYGDLTECNGGSNGIPPDVTDGVGQVASIVVASGVITVTPKATHGLTAADTYVLTPTLESDTVTWAVSGGGCAPGYIANCSGS